MNEATKLTQEICIDEYLGDVVDHQYQALAINLLVK